VVTDEERRSFGWLGSIPPEIQSAGREIVAKWKRLAQDAKRVARMANTHSKVKAAKAIEDRYYTLIEQARYEQKARDDKRKRTEGEGDPPAA
jgi:hypothetical protein